MPFFSRKSKDKESKKVEQKRTTSAGPAGTQPARGRNVLTKAQSQPASRSNSMKGDIRITHPAYAQNHLINLSSAQSYLPVPQIPAEMQKSAGKAARVLGVESRAVQSAPVSPKLRPRAHTTGDSEDSTQSRHDSVNSNVDAPRKGRPESNFEPQLSFSDELDSEDFIDSARPDEHFRRSMSHNAARSHERTPSHDSFRPSNIRRYTSHNGSRSIYRQDSMPHEERGRSHQQIPSYSMPTNASREDLYPEAQVAAPLPGAHQPLNRSYSAPREQQPSSPFMRPRPAFAEETSSIRSFTPQPPLLRHQSHRSVSLSPPLAILEGLKVNKRGKILDEEGDAIGELVEGDIIDCVRQRANAFGEVTDEFGRVVGRVRTLLSGMGVSTPSLNMSSPAIMDNRNQDYFNLQTQSPMLAPSIDAQSMQRRMHDEARQKYRITMDIPPVPAMPAAYQDDHHSASAHKRHTVGAFENFDGTHCAELPADGIEPLESIPVFDLSEPFMPTPSSERSSASPLSAKEELADIPVVRDVVASPEVPEKSRQRGLSMSKEDAVKPVVAAPPLPADNIDAAITSDDEDEFEEAEEPRFVLMTPEKPIIHVAVPQQTSQQQQQQQQQSPRSPVSARESLPSVKAIQAAQPALRDAVVRPEQTVANARHSMPEQTRPILASRAKTAPTPATSQSMASAPAPPRAEPMSESMPLSASTSEYNSAEESVSEGEAVEIQTVQRKGVRISNLPPTTIPSSRTLSRSISDSRFSLAMPSVPESEPLPDAAPLKSALSAPARPAFGVPATTNNAPARPAFGERAIGSRNSAPLPAFPRQNFSNLPSSPFAAANAAKNAAGLQKRASLPNRPGVPPPAVRAAMLRNNRHTMNAPLVSSPLSSGNHRRALSSITASSASSMNSDCTPSGSDNGKSDAISIYSTPAKTRTYFTHAGRVTVEEGDAPPSALKKDEVVVTELPLPSKADNDAVSVKESIKKKRFSIKLGRKSNAVAAH